MKKILALVLFLSLTQLTMAQTINAERKYISVTGTAEMEVVPDEIYFRITLKEFIKDKNKVQIETLEKELVQAIAASGISNDNFTIEQFYGERWRQKKSKIAELYNSKSYIIKVSVPSKIDDILDKINPESIESVEICNYSHSKIQEYKKQLLTDAIKAAKVKAGYLLNAIDEQLGAVIEVSEEGTTSYSYFAPVTRNNYSNSFSGTSYEDSTPDNPSIGFQKIKLQFQVEATFAIK
jgi:uncharacterized protein YggE